MPSSSESVSAKSEIEQLYLTEIQNMMYGCGDCVRPLLSTAKIIASAVQQQMLLISWRAEDHAVKRGMKMVTPPDLIFLLRKSPDKLRRLYQYLAVKEMRPCGLMTQDWMDLNVDEILDTDLTNLLDSNRRSKHPALMDMFVDVDTSGNFIEFLANSSIDPVRQKRNMRADATSQQLDPAGYLEFTRARQAAFVNRRLSQQRFLEWLTLAIDTSPGLSGEAPPSFPRLSIPAIDILAYLAKETLATIVDLALAVRQDSSTAPHGGQLRPVTLRFPPVSSASGPECISPLTPAEVREVLRRFTSPLFTQSAAFARNSSPGSQLLAC